MIFFLHPFRFFFMTPFFNILSEGGPDSKDFLPVSFVLVGILLMSRYYRYSLFFKCPGVPRSPLLVADVDYALNYPPLLVQQWPPLSWFTLITDPPSAPRGIATSMTHFPLLCLFRPHRKIFFSRLPFPSPSPSLRTFFTISRCGEHV